MYIHQYVSITNIVYGCSEESDARKDNVIYDASILLYTNNTLINLINIYI
jgi:hypothetical protein